MSLLKRSGKHRHSKSKWSKFWKKHKKAIRNISLLLLALLLVVTVAVLADLYTRSGREQPQNAESEQKSVLRAEVPYFDGPVSLVPELAQKFMDRDLTENTKEYMDRINESKERLDLGLPVTLYLDVSGVPGGCVVASATVEVSEHPDYSDPRLFTMGSGQLSVNVHHLKTNTQYYYRITYTLSNGTVHCVGSGFKTAHTPRVLSIDGTANVRDIGGWTTTDGKTLRQGLLYRGSELDGAVEAKYVLTEAGRYDMLTVLGIRTDMDLRAATDNPYGTDALGANVRHIYYGASAYSDVFTPYGKSVVKQLFGDLAVKDNYPVYLHCTYGMDRTGTICYLLEALLGVSEEDLLREYELSGLYNGYTGTEYLQEMIAQLKGLEGDTLQQKTENFLLDAGVTAEQIAAIRQIFLED